MQGPALGAANLAVCIGPVIGGWVALGSGSYEWVFWCLVMYGVLVFLSWEWGFRRQQEVWFGMARGSRGGGGKFGGVWLSYGGKLEGMRIKMRRVVRIRRIRQKGTIRNHQVSRRSLRFQPYSPLYELLSGRMPHCCYGWPAHRTQYGIMFKPSYHQSSKTSTASTTFRLASPFLLEASAQS